MNQQELDQLERVAALEDIRASLEAIDETLNQGITVTLDTGYPE